MTRRLLLVSAISTGAFALNAPVNPVAAGDPDVAVRSYAIPGHGTLLLKVPLPWKDSVRQPPGDMPPTIELKPATGEDFHFLITAIWDLTGKGNLGSVERLRADVRMHGMALLANAQEQTLTVEELKCDAGTAVYFTLTDKDQSSQAGYPFMTQGEASIGDLLLTFTLLYRKKESPEKNAALNLLKTAVHTALASTSESAKPSCDVFHRRIHDLYDFKPSAITAEQLRVKAAAEDQFWRDVQEHKAEMVPCLREALENPNADPWFLIDASHLLVMVGPSSESKSMMIRLWENADLRDIPGQRFVQALSKLGAEGYDLSNAAGHWLSSNARYFLPIHMMTVGPFEGAIFLYGSMDEAQATPALLKLAHDEGFAKRSEALQLLGLQMTPESLRALKTIELSGLQKETVEEVQRVLARPEDIPAAGTPVAFTRTAVVEAFERFLAGDHRSLLSLQEDERKWADGLTIVLAEGDIPLLRRVRRYRLTFQSDEALEEYMLYTRVLHRLLWKFDVVK